MTTRRRFVTYLPSLEVFVRPPPADIGPRRQISYDDGDLLLETPAERVLNTRKRHFG
jgi:hypothetical protein